MQGEPVRRGNHGRRRAGGARGGLVRALLLTVASAAVPGTAHLSRKRWGAGLLLLGLFLAVGALVAFAATGGRQELFRLLLDPQWLLGIILGTVALAVAWSASIVWSFAAVRPRRLSEAGQAVATLTLIALCALVSAPLLLAATYAQTQRGLLTDIFPDTAVSEAPGDDDPWGRDARLNVLLLGGDQHPGTLGVRTDAIILASIDPTTGRTVLVSLPRNLQWAPMPFEAMRERFPAGFPKFLYALWRYGARHPQLVPGAERPGAHLLTETVEEITGLPVDYYVLVDVTAFKELVNALGGVWMKVQEPVRYGKNGRFVVEEGYQKLSGREALWYARSRYHTSDYSRMRRQRCLLGALTNQADPLTVLRNFRELAEVAKRTVSTNIPRDLLPDLVDLAPKIKSARITNLQLVPPLVDPADPNYAKIQELAQRAVSPPDQPADAPAAASPEEGVEPAQPAEPAQPPEGEQRSAEAGPDGTETAEPDAPTPDQANEQEWRVPAASPEAASPVSLRAACPTIARPAERAGR